MDAPPVQPVILGGDIGAYSLARTFHEAYGVRAVVVSTVATGVVHHSRAISNVVVPGVDEPEVAVATLRRIAEQCPDRELMLFGSADWLVRIIVEHRAELADRYLIPYVTKEKLDLVTDKQRFARLCRELDLPHPVTLVHDVASGDEPDTSELRFPVIAKTADTAAYHRVEFPGKKKVFTIADREQLLHLLDRLRAAGYRGSFLIQDFIPGDDSGMRILTCYCDRNGKVVFASFGHVLLEEHTPGALGNPAGIITQANPQIVEQARRLLEHIGWTGYANFDLKYDPRTGRTVFFELNPRLGRSNYYVTAAGQNTAELYVREHLGLPPVPDGRGEQLGTEHLYTVLPRNLLLRYLDRDLRRHAQVLFRSGRATNPLWYRAERDPRRLAYLVANQINQYRKYRRYHPPVALPVGEVEVGR